MNASCQLKDQILEAALPDIVFDGWSDLTLTKAIDTLGLDKDIYRATFPAERLVNTFHLEAQGRR